MWSEHWDLAPSEFFHTTLDRAAKAFASNREANKRRARMVRLTLVAFSVEALAAALAALAAAF